MAKERRAVTNAAASRREILLRNLQKTSAQPNHQAKTLCPVATPGCACLPPGRRIHHLNMLVTMVIAQILQ